MEPVPGPGSCLSFFFQPLRDRHDSFGTRHAVELATVDELAVPRRGRQLRCFAVSTGLGWLDDLYYRKFKLFRKIKIPLVVSGDGHDGAGTVFHEHVVRHPNGNVLTRGRIASVRPGEHSGLLLAAHLTADDIHRRRSTAVFLYIVPLLDCRERLNHRVLGGEHHPCRSEDRVGSCCENSNRVARRNLKLQNRSLGAPDPVGLHQTGRIGPVELLEIFEESRRVLGDREEPLLEKPLVHISVRMPLAKTIDHLLVGQHGLALRTPVHGSRLLHGEPGLEQLEENPLGPLVVRWIDSRELVFPIDHQPHPLQLLAKPFDIPRNELPRVRVHLEGVVFRVDAERVEAEGLEHVESL